MKPAALEKLVWVLIYGGLLAVCFGVFVARAQPATGWGISIVGGIVAAVGFVLIWVRARMNNQQGS